MCRDQRLNCLWKGKENIQWENTLGYKWTNEYISVKYKIRFRVVVRDWKDWNKWRRFKLTGGSKVSRFVTGSPHNKELLMYEVTVHRSPGPGVLDFAVAFCFCFSRTIPRRQRPIFGETFGSWETGESRIQKGISTS